MAIGKVSDFGNYQEVRFPKDFQVEPGDYEIHKSGDKLILRKVAKSAKKKTSGAPSKRRRIPGAR